MCIQVSLKRCCLQGQREKAPARRPKHPERRRYLQAANTILSQASITSIFLSVPGLCNCRICSFARLTNIMLLQHKTALNAKRVVLASGSKQRRELLSNMGVKFEILVSRFDEKLPKDRFPSGAEYALETARHKALDVAAMVSEQQQQQHGPPVDLIISADTVVEADGVILEKPDDEEHAFQMISSLSGRDHQVHTGVSLVLPGEPDPSTGQPPFVRSFSVTTDVTFAKLSPETIRAYVASGEPFGKAGSYGIQGPAGSFVVGLRGCFYNVVGFPLHRFCAEVLALVEEGRLKL
ncbi:hypothetical protein PLESTB_001723400 [Pleodorina starrii]|uniref:Uncharacterized protein n=1 Tax=Pleodorina starrii TaxID=330485 RepID=A0A9W6BZJ4_9CHLO|nr:hypothetical protein PLESTM_002009300 [Pleodorina starrii]GLC61148.1 hypothetical protein PLESTB_001723400 [Pleodorina starrii]GLC70112.1 hypothetical protein PLESTF_000925400 [Pleodorina starrii]